MTHDQNDDNSSIVWHAPYITRADREQLLGQRGALIWFTGLSGSGKSTLANEAARMLHAAGRLAYVIDGDNVRHGLNSNLGFSPEDRRENIRRIRELAALFVDAGMICLAAFISPYRADRDAVRKQIGDGSFFEVYVEADIAVCEKRDPKGMYKKARAGLIKNYTGIDAPYEAPLHPELVVNTEHSPPADCAAAICAMLENAGITDPVLG